MLVAGKRTQSGSYMQKLSTSRPTTFSGSLYAMHYVSSSFGRCFSLFLQVKYWRSPASSQVRQCMQPRSS